MGHFLSFIAGRTAKKMVESWAEENGCDPTTAKWLGIGAQVLTGITIGVVTADAGGLMANAGEAVWHAGKHAALDAGTDVAVTTATEHGASLLVDAGSAAVHSVAPHFGGATDHLLHTAVRAVVDHAPQAAEAVLHTAEHAQPLMHMTEAVLHTAEHAQPLIQATSQPAKELLAAVAPSITFSGSA